MSASEGHDSAPAACVSEPTAQPLPASLDAPRYVVIDRLGDGGMGEVFRAYDPRLHREVALKRLRRNSSDAWGEERLIREARAMAALSHPNVVEIFDVEVEAGGVTLAMEYVRGTTLDRWLSARRRGWNGVEDVFCAAGRGLAAAHRAGLVHRDFKPTNVIVADDGAVKVTDFGLAEPARDQGLPSTPVVVSTEGACTHGGVVMGTPAYMAPEHHEGAADARSDQYSFCVALWEAVVGQRPFTGDDTELHAAKRAGPPPWPHVRDVPPRVAEALRRGLEPRPEARWPDMEALLDGLRTPVRPRWWPIGVFAGGAVVLASVLVTPASEEPCTGGAARMADVWNEARAEMLGRHLIEGGVAPEGELRTLVRSRIDDHVEEWTKTYREICEATAVRGEQPERMMDLRMACLERIRVRLDETLGVMLDTDPEQIEASERLSSTLVSARACRELGASRDVALLPDDPGLKAKLDRAQRGLARAHALYVAGESTASLEIVSELERESVTAHYAPLSRELEFTRGQALARLGRNEDSIVAFGRALREALADHDWALAEGSARELARAHANVDNFERAQAYLRVVQALETRDEFTNEDRGSTLTAAAELHLRRGEYARAYDAYDRAVGVLDSGETSHSYHIGQARLGRAAALSELGRFEDAIADQRWALARWTRELGPRHPFVASAMANLGISLLRLERIEEAIPLLRQAIEIHSEANGPHHRETGFLHDNLAYAYTLAKDFEKAEVEHDKAIAIISKALGPEHRHVAIARDNRALALRELGRYDEAETEHRRALAVFEKQLGVGHPDTERCRLLLAQLLTKQEKVDEAVALMESALSRLENEGDRRATAVARFQLGRLLLRMDRPRAVQLLETSWSVLRIDRNVPPTTRVAAGLALAQALWPSDPSRARSLALTLDSVVRAHPDLVLVRQRLHTWLESHGPGDEGSGDR